ncbi:major facilitator superfamily domain-containing protein [Coniella lustricola]|uniref:Major facilitator superfamily domain-containing protein n=1 Tax=Coniella lustricola TaxID=2025994 RepID=A0A2T3AA93_9PEZI|nr:major facilitator superfamily domain-containing protein [Coniella lustricola]
MVYGWQLWLSPRPTQRSKYVHDENVLVLEDDGNNEAASATRSTTTSSSSSSNETAKHVQIFYDFHTHKGHRATKETHYRSSKTVRDGESGPPLHIHLRQTETFEVEQGVLGVVKNGVEYAIRKEDGPVSIPPGVRHKFWFHATSDQDLIFNVCVDPEGLDHGFDESFMRNLQGYNRDCAKHGIPPSLFQILLFLYDSDVVITPPFWTPIWLLKGLHHVFAYWIGAGLLGVQYDMTGADVFVPVLQDKDKTPPAAKSKHNANSMSAVTTEITEVLMTPALDLVNNHDSLSKHMSNIQPGRPSQTLEIEDGAATVADEEPLSGAATAEDETKYPTGIRFWLIILCNAVVLVFMGLDVSIVSTAVPSITDEFHTVRDVGWYSSAFRLCNCSFAFMFGKLYTLFAVRTVFLTSLAIFMCGSLLSATAPSSLVFIISRAICGFGCIGVIQGCFFMITHLVPLRKRPALTGALAAAEGVADIASPSIGGFIIGRLSWRWCFWINLPMGVASFLIIAFTLRLDQQPSPLTFSQKLVELDLVGNALFVPALTSLFLALSWAGTTYSWTSGTVLGLLATFVVLLACFVYDQYRRGDRATLPPRIMSNRSVLAGVLFASCTNATMGILVYYLPTYFQTVREFSPTRSGYLMIPFLVANLVGFLLHGGAVTAVGYYTPFMLLGSVLMPIFAGLLTTLTASTATGKVLGYTSAMGFAAGVGFQGPQSAVQTVLPTKDAALGLGVIMFAQQFGPAVFVVAAQSIFLNRLSDNLRDGLGVDVPVAELGGLTDIKTLVGEANIARALGVLDASLMQAWYLPVGLAAATMVGSLAMEWRSVKDRKRD